MSPIVSSPISSSSKNTYSLLPSSLNLLYSLRLKGTSPMSVLIELFRIPLCLSSALFLFLQSSLSSFPKNSPISVLATSQPISKKLLSISLNVSPSPVKLFISRSPFVWFLSILKLQENRDYGKTYFGFFPYLFIKLPTIILL